MHALWNIVEHAESRAAVVDAHRHAQPGSAFMQDKVLCPNHPSVQPSHFLLLAAQGSLASLRRVLNMREDDDEVSMTLDLYGVYDIIRGALECSARSLYVTAPVHPRKRVRRCLILLSEDHKHERKAAMAAGVRPAKLDLYKAEQEAQVAGYAAAAGIEDWPPKRRKQTKPLSEFPPTSSQILELARIAVDWPTDPYTPATPLAAWHLASGMAHGQQWAPRYLHQFSPPNMESMEVQARPSYLHTMSLAVTAATLLDVALSRHVNLCTAGGYSGVMKMGRPWEQWVPAAPET